MTTADALADHATLLAFYPIGNSIEVKCWCGWSEVFTRDDVGAALRRKAWAEHVMSVIFK